MNTVSRQVPDYGTLQANLYLASSDFNSLMTHLAGYSEFGIYQECLEGIRQPMEEFSAMIRSGELSNEVLGQLFDCYFLMENLARYPRDTNSAEAFKSSEEWDKFRVLAKSAADALESIRQKYP
jgi:hypothetical protein